VPIALEIDCMECGGRAHLAQPVGLDDELEAGDILTYVCGDCAHRWDVVVDETDVDDG
jgi:uncharacterized protein YlaI